MFGISNKGELDAEGVEDVLSFKFGPVHGFANYTYTTAELTEPQTGTGKVYDVPKHKGNLALMWQLPRGGSAGLTLRWHGGVETRYHDETFRVDDYLVTDLTAGPFSLPGNDATSFQLIIKNVIDEEYFHPEPRAPGVVMHPQDGRSVELRLRWRSAL